jgi:hypothetical protein
MEDSRPMATLMVTNLRKIDSSASKLANPREYGQLIGSLMYLVNTRPDICFVVNTLSQFAVEQREVHWVAAKHQILAGHSTIWIAVPWWRWCEVAGLLRSRLGKQ